MRDIAKRERLNESFYDYGYLRLSANVRLDQRP
jgi:hypothetical protein